MHVVLNFMKRNFRKKNHSFPAHSLRRRRFLIVCREYIKGPLKILLLLLHHSIFCLFPQQQQRNATQLSSHIQIFNFISIIIGTERSERVSE